MNCRLLLLLPLLLALPAGAQRINQLTNTSTLALSNQVAVETWGVTNTQPASAGKMPECSSVATASRRRARGDITSVWRHKVFKPAPHSTPPREASSTATTH